MIQDKRQLYIGLISGTSMDGCDAALVAFEKGQPYPTIHLDKIQNRLEDLSREVATTVQTRFKELHDVYVPLSMALLTRYDEAYLGIGPAKKEEA